MKLTVGKLRKLIRGVLLEYGEATAASGVDPTDKKGFYPYELERGTDIHSFWYKSPGRGVGGDGDPGRPANALDYIGMSPKKSKEEPEAEAGETPAAPAAGPTKQASPVPQAQPAAVIAKTK